jgi:hypothetical protein
MTRQKILFMLSVAIPLVTIGIVVTMVDYRENAIPMIINYIPLFVCTIAAVLWMLTVKSLEIFDKYG